MVTGLLTHLADNPVLVLFLLIGLGMLVGHIKIKGVSLGAAAVLFAGIILAAWGVSQGVTIEVPASLGTLGLAIFTFAIGVQSGPNFFHVIRTAVGPLALMLGAFVVAAAAGLGVGRALGMDSALIAGTFAGAITNTPALAAAGNAATMAGNPDGVAVATVGYAVAYLYGVIGMLFFCLLALRYRRSDKDKPSPLVNRTIRVERDDSPLIGDIAETISGELKFSRLRRGESGPITRPRPTDRVNVDDLVTVVGTQDAVNQVIKALGHGSSHSLIEDRRYLDFRRITVSDPKLAGHTVAELGVDEKFGATISRVRRGDTDMVGTPDLVLQQGDRVRVVGPTSRMKEISKYFGDSSRGLSSINPVALGIGMAIGIIIGEWKFLTPTGATFSIGSAAGTLLVGLIFGKIGRIKGFVTALPFTATAVLAEFGLLVFLAQAGTKAGGQIANAFTGGDWWKILVTGFVITTIVGFGLYASMRWIVKMGGTRLSGLLGGAQTQPAVLAFANERTGADPRVALGYAMVYPVAMIGKIFVAQILGGL
ncbi:MAG: TrkA C-terminal domain-containing protein [Actinomyces urogenitalis]|uniref:aspartate:alanine exchanger family transporter n=1 Tax=Actinomyces urogenitalis TaxID=103621 RepID=UPI00242E3BEB|nr:TrkA C-terminal domain-containing protein [Actinomyces urogenitalis]MCI7455918.1 transporter [Actinomyces urogenitalis]MDY3679611.1 TrkA C-terminal domain-containing protein [Actinomyces urogenitalis]